MEYADPEKIKLQRLLKVNGFLTKTFVVILLALSIFIFKYALLAVISVQKSGIASDSVWDIIKHHFLAFFNSLGDLSAKHMLFVSMILFINLVGIAANRFWKLVKSGGFYIILFFVSIVAGFNLPIEKMYNFFTRGGKTGLSIFCLLMMICVPWILGRYLGKDEIISLILSKTFYVIIFGLLLVQLLIEW